MTQPAQVPGCGPQVWRFVLGLVLLIAAVSVIAGQSDDKAPDKVPQRTPAGDLSTLDGGAVGADEYDAGLHRLAGLCKPDNEIGDLADIVVVAQEQVKKGTGQKLSLLVILNGLVESVPDQAAGFISCRELAAAWTTITISGAR